MKGLTLKILILLTTTFLIICEDNSTVICRLTGAASRNPFPSLTKCYKYNSDACCLSVHDDFINNYVQSLLTPSCIRKYQELEDLFCLGCHPLESTYTDQKNKVITLCPDFAMKLWNATDLSGLQSSTTKFDNCGFKITDSLKAKYGDSQYIIPSKAFTCLEDFISQIKIPFYDDYSIQVVNTTNCFSIGDYTSVSYVFFLLILLL